MTNTSVENTGNCCHKRLTVERRALVMERLARATNSLFASAERTEVLRRLRDDVGEELKLSSRRRGKLLKESQHTLKTILMRTSTRFAGAPPIEMSKKTLGFAMMVEKSRLPGAGGKVTSSSQNKLFRRQGARALNNTDIFYFTRLPSHISH